MNLVKKMGIIDETRTIQIDIPQENLIFRKYKLSVISGKDKGKSEVMKKREIYIGTNPDCEFFLDDPTVSRNHAKIVYDLFGYKIEDFGSKNGTFINDIRVKNAYIPDGATIKMGETQILFSLEKDSVEVPISKSGRFGSLIGESYSMREIFAILSRVAPTDATILIEGESGTGKEVAAETIHLASNRREGAFVIFDCATIPKELMESEIFGHIKGAFTGATSDRAGAMCEAEGGSLFIDEVGDLPLELQPKLLRALEKKEIKPVGSNKWIKIDCRIIAATNKDLAKEVELKNFREDLYYRLAVVKVKIPPLRHRVEDIPPLVRHFLNEFQQKSNIQGKLNISYETMTKLMQYPWYGNVRELKNFIERAVILTDSKELSAKFLSSDIGEDGKEKGGDGFSLRFDLPFKEAKERLVSSFERSYFQRLLTQTDGNITKAAQKAGIHRKSLEYLIKKLDLQYK